MSWAILTEEDGISTTSILYCNTTDVAFGPVMYDTGRDEAEHFVSLLGEDPRTMRHDTLSASWGRWQTAREAAQL